MTMLACGGSAPDEYGNVSHFEIRSQRGTQDTLPPQLSIAVSADQPAPSAAMSCQAPVPILITQAGPCFRLPIWQNGKPFASG